MKYSFSSRTTSNRSRTREGSRSRAYGPYRVRSSSARSGSHPSIEIPMGPSSIPTEASPARGRSERRNSMGGGWVGRFTLSSSKPELSDMRRQNPVAAPPGQELEPRFRRLPPQRGLSEVVDVGSVDERVGADPSRVAVAVLDGPAAPPGRGLTGEDEPLEEAAREPRREEDDASWRKPPAHP